MSDLTKPSSSSVSVGSVGRRRRVERGRGIPKYCQCGEEAVIRTSGTTKNPGRLFYCCPYGHEGDKYHLFTWTDERVVEEVEDLKTQLSEVKGELSMARKDICRLEKQVEQCDVIMKLAREKNGGCVIS